MSSSLPTMDSAMEPSSYNESLALGLLLLGLVFLTFLHPKMVRPKLFILLVACMAQLPTVTATDKINLNTPVIVKQGRRPQPPKLINSGLDPTTERAAYFILMVYGFVILNLVLWGFGIFLDLLIPFLPLVYALGGFSIGLNELDSMAVETSTVATNVWIVLLPNVVFFYSGFRKHQHTQEYMILDVLSIGLGYIQRWVEGYQSQKVLWAPFAIKGILAGHLLISVLHLLYTFSNPVHKFRAIIESYFNDSAAFAHTNRYTRRVLDKRGKKEAAKRKRN